MSSDMMRICGKTDSATAKGVSVASDGSVRTDHKWNCTIIKLFDAMEIRDDSYHWSIPDKIDLTGYAYISLRVVNTLGTQVEIRFANDIDDGTYPMLLNSNGTIISYVLPSGSWSNMFVVTPDELPILQYLTKMKVWAKPASQPSEGSLTIWIVAKR